MRNGKNLATAVLLVGRHPLPEVLGIDAIVIRVRQEVLNLLGIVPEDDDSVQVVGFHGRRPFEAVQRRENARLVVFFRGLHDAPPDRERQCIVVDRVLPGGHLEPPLAVSLERLARLDQVMHFLAPGVAQQTGVGLFDQGRETQVFRMIRDHQEIERPNELRPHTARRPHQLSAREPVSEFRTEKVADHAGVGRIGGV